MRKISTVLVRDPDNRAKVLPQVTPGCEWVFDGEGVATRKYDGTCVMLNREGWWARREVRPGKATPPNFVPVDTDPVTGKTQGWEPIEQSSFYKFWQESRDSFFIAGPRHPLRYEFTYELVGPKINGNPEHLDKHELILHAFADRLPFADHPGSAEDAIGAVKMHPEFEGIVWHHPDGRMAKLKVRDV